VNKHLQQAFTFQLEEPKLTSCEQTGETLVKSFKVLELSVFLSIDVSKPIT